jgi:transposase
MADYSEVFVGIDTSKLRNAVAIAEGGRNGEVRYLGEFGNTEAATSKLVKKLAAQHQRLTFCYEAGPTGYGLHRLIKTLGHECVVVAPSLIPKKPGDRVKTNRRDALNLAKLLRAGELTAVWVPDARHEAMRDLVRAREAAVDDLKSKRQQVLSLLLRLGRHFTGKRTWTRAHMNWLVSQKLAHREQRIAFEEMLLAVRQAEERDPARAGDRCGSAGLVACKGGDGTDGRARSRSHFGYDFPRRDRRPVALCQPAPIDGLSRLGAGRRVDW